MLLNRKIFISIVLALIVLVINFSFLFIFHYPAMARAAFNFLGDDSSLETNIIGWTFIIFRWFIFLIILISFIFIFNIALEIKKDNLFSDKVLKYNKISIMLFLFDIFVMFIGYVFFKIFNFPTIEYLDFIVAFIIFSLVFLQMFFSCIVKNEMKKEILIFRVFIIIFALVIISIVGIYYPYILSSLLEDKYVSVTLKMDNITLFTVPYVVFSIATLPLLIVMILFWKITNYMKNNQLFSKEVVKLISISIIILSISVLIFLISNYYFFNSRWLPTSLYFIRFSFLFAILIFILSIFRAIIKREALINSIKK